MNLDTHKVDIIIQKINYLFKSIKKNQDNTLSAEQILLKKYATDLLDAMLEAEMRHENIDLDLMRPPVLSNEINDTGLIALQNLKQSNEVQQTPQSKIVDFDEKFVAQDSLLQKDTNIQDFNPFSEEINQNSEENLNNELEAQQNNSDFDDLIDIFENHDSFNPTEKIESEDLQYIPNEKPQVLNNEEEEEDFTDVFDEFEFDEDDPNVRTEVLGSLQAGLKKNEEPQKEVKKEINDFLAGDKKKNEVTLADKFRQSLTSNKFDISDTQRNAFINELFNGDADAYENLLKELNNRSTLIDAFSYINLHAKMKYNWDDNNVTTRTFQEIVKNGFYKK